MDISSSDSVTKTLITSSDTISGNESEEISEESRTLHDYLTIETLGRGAQGSVEKVRRKRDGQIVAIKVITTKNIERAKSEVEILEEISKINGTPQCNPFLACYLDHFYDFENGKFIIEMEYISGKNLKKFILESPVDKRYLYLLLILKDLVTGLQLVHSKNIIHSDIKPDNILITSDLVPKLVDFGLGCKAAVYTSPGDRNECPEKELVGTPQFVAPETIERNVRYFSSDIWSLGVTLYYCAVNTYPFSLQGLQTPQILSVISRTEPNKLYTDNGLLNSIVDRCLIKDPFKRISLNEISEKLKILN